jgi:hypothetical protein
MIALLVVGIVGIYMKRFGWSRPALLIGLVLSQRLEASLYRTVQIYGFDIFLRPICLVILLLAAVSIYLAVRAKTRVAAESGVASHASKAAIWPQVIFVGVLLAFVIALAIDVSRLRFLANVFPLSVAAVATVLLVITGIRMIRRSDAPGLLYDADAELGPEVGGARGTLALAGLMAALPALSVFVGFFLAAPIYLYAFLRRLGGASVALSLGLAIALAACLAFMGRYLEAEFAQGVLQSFVTLPFP